MNAQLRITVIPLTAILLCFSGQSAERTSPAVDISSDVIRPFNYEGVHLLPGRLKNQFEQTTEFYMALRPNDILHGFRQRAGKPAPGKSLGGAYGETALGFGQWLAGLSRLSKACGHSGARDRAIYLMHEWGKTIDEDGYFGVRPRPRGPGHYGYDKMVGGLIDVYEYTGDPKALEYLARITDWAEKNLDRSNEYALPTEWYTLAENLYRAYELSGDKRYLEFARVWDYPGYWGALARGDNVFRVLENAVKHRSYHAYSHVNSLSSAAMAYRVTGDRHYLDTIVKGYEFLRDTQLYATGGYGPEESFIVPNGMPETLLGIRRGEANVDVRFHFETSCGSWAGFKLSKYLMRFTGEARYGDWIERLVYNGVGAMVPMNDYGMIMYGSCYNIYGARKSHSTVWFCCQGSFLQTVTDYHDLIYLHDRNNLYVNLFIPSEVDWKSPTGAVRVRQETRFPEEETTRLRISTRQPARFGLKFRVPLWAKDGVAVALNGTPIEVETSPGEWAIIDREWMDEDVVTLRFDLSIRAEPLPGYVTPVAVLCGPVVMVMATARESEGSLPFEGPLTYPGDWLEVNAQATLNPARQLHTSRLLRPFYEIETGEYYNLYFERSGKRNIPLDQVTFDGNWAATHTGTSSDQVGDSFEVDFTGSVLVWEGLRHEDAGIATVSIDGEPVTEVDQYGYNGVHVGRMDQREVPFRWFAKDLGEGKHTVKVTVTDRKNAESTGTRINVIGLSSYP